MDFFQYKNGRYMAEDVAIEEIAKEIPTPFYCYSKATFSRHISRLQECLSEVNQQVCYAVKANYNLDLLRIVASLGAGADVVSAGEIEFALAAGIKPEHIVFSGVGKSEVEIRYALTKNIFQFNIESDDELEMINRIAGELGKKAAIAVRVNPDVEAGTHAKISTGHKTSKFGIPMQQALTTYKKAASMEHIYVQGVSMHIGSQLTNLDPIEQAMSKVVEYVGTLESHGITLETIDVGGGLGVPYGNHETASLEDYAALIVKHMKPLGKKVLLEPGRMIAANAGILVSKVIRIKDHEGHHFLIIDAGMNNLLRPSLYNAYHEILPVNEPAGDTEKINYDVVGPICETGDIFAESRPLPKFKSNDLLLIRSAGAYGAVMGSRYNLHPEAAEILVDGNSYKVSRSTKSVAELLENYGR